MGKHIIIDVREPFEFASGHVEGAINLPLAQIMAGTNRLDDVPKDTKLIVYCRSGGRSATSIKYLEKMGFTDLINGINTDHVNSLELA